MFINRIGQGRIGQDGMEYSYFHDKNRYVYDATVYRKQNEL